MDEKNDNTTKLIGQVTVNYSGLEFILCACIWKLLELDDNKGRVVTSGLQFNVLLNMFGGLCHNAFKDAEPLAHADKCVKMTIQASEQRNQLIHSTLLYSDTGVFAAFKYRSKGLEGLKRIFKKLGEPELKQHVELIDSARNELSYFYAKYLHKDIEE